VKHVSHDDVRLRDGVAVIEWPSDNSDVDISPFKRRGPMTVFAEDGKASDLT
jgi:hypothetical protein